MPLTEGNRQSIFGCDYGIRPKIAVVGDLEFQSKLGDHFVALGYTSVPSFGLLVDPPVLAMLFDTKGSARECFAHFTGWAKGSESGDAVGIGFVEFESNEYAMCIYQDPEMLLRRTIPEAIRPEVDPMFMALTYMKVFPAQSKGYVWFKTAVRDSPFVLVPAASGDAPMMDLVVTKRSANFYREREVPEHSPEGAILRLRASEGETELHRPMPESMKPQPDQVAARRRHQLRRFFPVTLERMQWSEAFKAVRKNLLMEGFHEWQVNQAWCNMSLHRRFPDEFEKGDSNVNVVDVLGRLVNTYEALGTSQMTSEQLQPSRLRAQIRADSVYLFKSVLAPEEFHLDGLDIQAELSKRGFIGD